LQAITRGVQGKVVIVLDAGEAFFLSGRNDFAINDEARSRIMIERGYTENVQSIRIRAAEVPSYAVKGLGIKVQ